MVSIPIVLLIFISSNQDNQLCRDSGIVGQTSQPPSPQGTTEKGFVDDGKSQRELKPQVNDLTAPNFKFPGESSGKKVLQEKKIIREKVLPDGEETKSKTPLPLYSLVKNECGEGYALDENGVCQKTITVRNGKTFDSERRKRRRRRKRFIPGYEFVNGENLKPRPRHDHYDHSDYIDHADGKIYKEISLGDDFAKTAVDCSHLYPGLVSDGAGGCKKPFRILDHPLNKLFPL